MFSSNEPGGGVLNTRGRISMAKVGGQPDSATNEWVLSMDADERVTPALAAEIRASTADRMVLSSEALAQADEHAIEFSRLGPPKLRLYAMRCTSCNVLSPWWEHHHCYACGGAEMVAVRPVLELQKKWSAVPGADEPVGFRRLFGQTGIIDLDAPTEILVPALTGMRGDLV